MDKFDLNKTRNHSNSISTDSSNSNSTINNMDVMFVGPNSNHSTVNAAKTNGDALSSKSFSNNFSSCKTLQRKLELKVERAKRNYSQHSANAASKEAKENSSCLIPIDRLSIPGQKEHLPLVEYKSEHSSDEDEMSSPFFPTKSKSSRKVDLSDTFSIQDMTIESDSDEDSRDSPNLELLPPTARIQCFDRLINYMCCWS